MRDHNQYSLHSLRPIIMFSLSAGLFISGCGDGTDQLKTLSETPSTNQQEASTSIPNIHASKNGGYSNGQNNPPISNIETGPILVPADSGSRGIEGHPSNANQAPDRFEDIPGPVNDARNITAESPETEPANTESNNIKPSSPIPPDPKTPNDSEPTKEILFSTRNNFRYANIPPIPNCDQNRPDVLFIKNNQDWDQINSTSKRIFCVYPGDYSSRGDIVLTADGSKHSRRYILLYNGNNTHPKDLKQSQMANVRLRFDGANYWVVDRMSSISARGTYSFYFTNNSTNNILNRVFTKNMYGAVRILNGSHNNIIQNSFIENMTKDGLKNDGVCIGLAETGRRTIRIYNTRILNNVIKNCNDGIQLVRYGSQEVDFQGTVIDGNWIFIEPELYTDCAGNSSPTGRCAQAENAIDLKGGSPRGDKPILISNNVMFGFRKSDKTNSSRNDHGAAVISHFGANNIIFKNNVILNSDGGFHASDKREFDFSLGNSAIENNIFFNIGVKKNNVFSSSILLESVENIKLYGNIVLNSKNSSWLWASGAKSSSVNCNVIYKANGIKGGPTGYETRDILRLDLRNNVYIGNSPSYLAPTDSTIDSLNPKLVRDVVLRWVEPKNAPAEMTITHGDLSNYRAGPCP